MTGLGTKAIDIRCDACGRPAGSLCAGVATFHQARVTKAARLTREANRAARTEVRGDVEIEREEPLIAHGAGPAASRRVRRNIWRKS